MKLEVDGKEIDLEGIEGDTVVIIRPTRELSREDMKAFLYSVKNLVPLFERHGCTLIGAGFNQVTFEVLKEKSQETK